MHVFLAAEAEKKAIIAKKKIMNGLASDTPSGGDQICKIGEEVLFYSENEKWAGL